MLQAAALTLIAVGFLATWPEVMSPKVFVAAVILFITGWFLERRS
jgi:hypothetical protein